MVVTESSRSGMNSARNAVMSGVRTDRIAARAVVTPTLAVSGAAWVLAVMRMSGMDVGPGSDLESRFGQALVMPVALGMIGLGLWVALGLL